MEVRSARLGRAPAARAPGVAHDMVGRRTGIRAPAARVACDEDDMENVDAFFSKCLARLARGSATPTPSTASPASRRASPAPPLPSSASPRRRPSARPSLSSPAYTNAPITNNATPTSSPRRRSPRLSRRASVALPESPAGRVDANDEVEGDKSVSMALEPEVQEEFLLQRPELAAQPPSLGSRRTSLSSVFHRRASAASAASAADFSPDPSPIPRRAARPSILDSPATDGPGPFGVLKRLPTPLPAAAAPSPSSGGSLLSRRSRRLTATPSTAAFSPSQASATKLPVPYDQPLDFTPTQPVEPAHSPSLPAHSPARVAGPPSPVAPTPNSPLQTALALTPNSPLQAALASTPNSPAAVASTAFARPATPSPVVVRNYESPAPRVAFAEPEPEAVVDEPLMRSGFLNMSSSMCSSMNTSYRSDGESDGEGHDLLRQLNRQLGREDPRHSQRASARDVRFSPVVEHVAPAMTPPSARAAPKRRATPAQQAASPSSLRPTPARGDARSPVRSPALRQARPDRSPIVDHALLMDIINDDYDLTESLSESSRPPGKKTPARKPNERSAAAKKTKKKTPALPRKKHTASAKRRRETVPTMVAQPVTSPEIVTPDVRRSRRRRIEKLRYWDNERPVYSSMAGLGPNELPSCIEILRALP